MIIKELITLTFSKANESAFYVHSNHICGPTIFPVQKLCQKGISKAKHRNAFIQNIKKPRYNGTKKLSQIIAGAYSNTVLRKLSEKDKIRIL